MSASLQHGQIRVDHCREMNTAPIISTSSVRLAELRRQISAGEYTIDPIAIAEILLRRWSGAGMVHTDCA